MGLSALKLGLSPVPTRHAQELNHTRRRSRALRVWPVRAAELIPNRMSARRAIQFCKLHKAVVFMRIVVAMMGVKNSMMGHQNSSSERESLAENRHFVRWRY